MSRTFPTPFALRYSTFVILWAVAAAFAQSGGGYVIKKSTIDGGGVTFHSGGVYRLGGAVGQHDAARLTGGDYKLTGGFWSPVIPPVPIPDLTGLNKSRFISFSIPTSEFTETAIRVKLVSLHHVDPPYTGGASVPFTQFEGAVLWVGPPTLYEEAGNSGVLFVASHLQCDPYYGQWSAFKSCNLFPWLCTEYSYCPVGGTCTVTVDPLLHVTGSAIVPSSLYEVETVAASCMGNEASCVAVSLPLRIKTARWGDVVDSFNPPDGSAQPDFDDIGALVNKFKSDVGAPIKARSMLAGVDDNGAIDLRQNVDFDDISADVDAFKGLPYPYTIAGCP